MDVSYMTDLLEENAEGAFFAKALVNTVSFLLWKVLSDFPGGPVAKNSPANAGDTGLIPGPGQSQVPWGRANTESVHSSYCSPHA